MVVFIFLTVFQLTLFFPSPPPPTSCSMQLLYCNEKIIHFAIWRLAQPNRAIRSSMGFTEPRTCRGWSGQSVKLTIYLNLALSIRILLHSRESWVQFHVWPCWIVVHRWYEVRFLLQEFLFSPAIYHSTKCVYMFCTICTIKSDFFFKQCYKAGLLNAKTVPLLWDGDRNL
jgi:hypothetical protein